jgi:hypothetical protein
MFIELVQKIELATCDLLMAKKSEIENILEADNYDSDFFAIGLGVYADHELIEISFATRENYDQYPTEHGYWDYYAFCSSVEITSDNITAAIAAMSEITLADDEDVEELTTEESIARSNLILFAAAQALMSKKVWRSYNQIKLALLEEKVDQWRREKKNMNVLSAAIEHYKGDTRSLQCVVADTDEPWRTNFCYMTEILNSVSGHSDEILKALGSLHTLRT